MHDADFLYWKKYPDRFFDLHQAMFSGIISKNCFRGHCSKNEIQAWEKLITDKMLSEKTTIKLAAFSFRSSFMVFYINTLKNIVISISQQEDIKLLGDDYDKLILKYSPLADIIILHLSSIHSVNSAKYDIKQQLMMNLLTKNHKL